jgi:glutamate-1-semialdehyde 2,1-aminomutase
LITRPGFFAALTAKTLQLADGLRHYARKQGIALVTQQAGGMFGLFFTDQPAIATFADVAGCDIKRFNRFFRGMLEQGIYLAPSAYEAGFVSAAHGETEIAETLAAAATVFKTL